MTELVLNALKHAFPSEKPDSIITVEYDVSGPNWKLAVSDNGVGKSEAAATPGGTGLGTGIVKALSQQLEALIETITDAEGTTVSIAHARPQKTALRAV